VTSPRFPGWRVVTGCLIVLTTTSGLGFYGLAVYLTAFSNERGWEVSSLSLATTLFFLVAGLTGLVVARLIDRFDVRAVVVGGGLLAGVALGVLGHVDARWQLYVLYAVFAVGWAASGLVPATTLITRWFHRRRSVALSVATTGLSLGGVVLTPTAKWLLDEHGLATITPVLGVAFVVGVVPWAVWLLRPDPATSGWLPDGERSDPQVAVRPPRGTTFADAVRSRFFVATTGAYILVMAAQVGGIQQLVKLVEERTTQRTAALVTVFLAGTSVIARLVGGRVVAHVPMVRFAAGLAVVQGLAMASFAFIGSTFGLLATIVLFGATVGNLLMLQPLMVSERFGVADYPRIFSRSQLVTTFGTAGGPWVLGWLRDHAGGYRASYLVAATLSTLGAVVLSTAGPAEVVDEPDVALPAASGATVADP
jgi:MFS family permease